MKSYVGMIGGKYVSALYRFDPDKNLNADMDWAVFVKEDEFDELNWLKKTLKKHHGKLLEVKTKEVKLPEQKYYLHIKGLEDEEFKFINTHGEEFSLRDSSDSNEFQTKFTQKEINEMNPKFNFDLNEIKVPVEDMEDDC